MKPSWKSVELHKWLKSFYLVCNYLVCNKDNRHTKQKKNKLQQNRQMQESSELYTKYWPVPTKHPLRQLYDLLHEVAYPLTDLLHSIQWLWYQSAHSLTDLPFTCCGATLWLAYTIYPPLPVGLPPGSLRGDLHTYLTLKWKRVLSC